MSTIPNQIWPSDAAIEALDGTTDPNTGLPYIAKGTGPTSTPSYEVQYNRRLQRQNDILATWRGGMVVPETGLTIGVYPLRYSLDGVPKVFSGATGVSLPDNDTRVVYLDSSGILQVQTTWPADRTTFIPLASVFTNNGAVSVGDRRDEAAFIIPEFTGSIGAADLSAALADLIPDVSISVGPESANTITVTVQFRDADGANLSAEFLARMWLSDTPGTVETATAPNAGTSFVPTTVLQTITTNKHWLTLTDSSGQTQLSLAESGAATWYLNVVFDGRVYTSSAITFV